jgi:hypothetical protein
LNAAAQESHLHLSFINLNDSTLASIARVFQFLAHPNLHFAEPHTRESYCAKVEDGRWTVRSTEYGFRKAGKVKLSQLSNLLRDSVPGFDSEMVILNFTLSPSGSSILHDILSCLSRFSDSVSFEARQDSVSLRIETAFGCYSPAADSKPTCVVL